MVAVKLFRLDLAPERVHQLVAGFEELISAELTHPAIAVPLATGISGVSAYLAHDYVAGESVDLAVRQYGPAPPADALRVAAQLAGALDFAAVVNVSHGTLHPRDVLVSTEQARLTGLGIAHVLDRAGIALPIRRPYTAPERALGSAWDRRADVFSLAALIYELLSGRRITGLGTEAAASLGDVAGARLSALGAAFARALAEDPRDRFETALEFAESLKGAFPDAVVIAATPAGKTATPARKTSEPLLPLEESFPLESLQPERTELELHATDPARYQDAAPPPVRHEIAMSVERPTVEPPAEVHPEPPAISVIERSRSAVWPLMAALVIGLALGFAGGYGMGTSDSPAAGRAESPAPASAESPAPPSAESPASAPQATPLPPAGSSVTSPAPAASNRATRNGAQSAARGADRSRANPSSRGRPPATVGTLERSSTAAPSGTAGGLSGTLSIESRPEGARVFVDGKLVGTTPLAIPNVSAGEHAVRLERDGYQRWSASVRVVASEQNRVTASLER